MKKHLLSLFALASMVFASSCTSEEIISQSTGNEVSVTFKTELRSDVKSRAVGENAHQIDQVEFAVYGENGYLSDLYKTATPRRGVAADNEDPNKMYAEINVVLVKGQTYSFAFWAQDKDYTAYDFAPATATVSIDYGKTANNYSADAFFAKINDFTVTGTFEQTVTLKRPFAQVNFLTTATDLDLAKKAGFEPSQSSIVVENAATSLNLLTGNVDGSEKATFTLADLVPDTETTTIKDSNNNGIEFETAGTATAFRYLATAYFLPTEATGEAQITASMSVKGNTSKTVDLTAAGITAQRNYRTNIYGNLLTSNGQFNVVIDPSFDGDHSVSTDEFTTIYTSVNDALIANKANTDAATYNVEAAEGETISNLTITIPDDTKAESLIFNLEDLASGADITITNEDNDADSYNKPVVVEVPAGANLGKLTINLPNAHVTLKNGTYSDMEVTTSNTTLEVGNGTEVTTLTVKQGNVRIAEGGKVGTITNSTNGTLYVLVGGEWTNIAGKDANTIVIYEDAEHTYVMNNMYSVDSKMEDLFAYAAVIGVKDITISLTDDVEGNVTIAQTETVDAIVIDGGNNEFDGTFYIHGNARYTGAETLTFKNINFKHADGTLDFISSNSTGAVERYAHNVTVENCTFQGNDNGDVVGMRYRQAYNIVVKNSTFTKMHSLMWATGTTGISLDNVTINDSKSGVSFGTSTNVSVENSNFEVKEHGIRADGSVATNLVVKNTTINATTPIIVRYATAAYKVALEGDVKLNATGAYNVVFTNGKDDAEYVAPTGEYGIIGADDNYNIYPMEEGAPMNASSAGQLSSVIKEGATTINLTEGTYKIPTEAKNKELTISGTEDTKIDITSGLTYVNGADITFKGVTIQSEPEGAGYTNGFADLKVAKFDNCVIDGTIGLDFTCEFNECTFNIEGNYYNVWTWGAGTATFNKCTFNCDGKALLVYANVLDNGTNHQTVNITECTFNDNGDDTVTGKAAIEITNTYTPIRTYDVIIKETKVNGFAQTVPGAGDFNAAYGSVENGNIGTNVWGNKCKLSNAYLNVKIDGVDVY